MYEIINIRYEDKIFKFTSNSYGLTKEEQEKIIKLIKENEKNEI